MIELLVSDFETTVDENRTEQTHTEVWAAGTCTVGKFDGMIFNSIDKWFDNLVSRKSNIICWFHNLKFDGSFIIDFFHKKGFRDSYISLTDELGRMPRKNELRNGEYSYSISGMGMWYKITLKYYNYYFEFRDSLKLLPFSLKEIGEAFKTKYRKSSIKYIGERYANGLITDSEREYLLNDLYVISEALDFFVKEHGLSLTIGSACLKEWKGGYDKHYLKEILPDLSVMLTPIDGIDYDSYIRKSYRGGWCYVVPEYAEKEFYNGVTLDVNSLYPSVMHSASGNRYPIENPTFFKGKIPDFVLNDKTIYYFVHFKCQFKIKEGYLPFIQNKHNFHYNGRLMLTTSDVWNPIEKKYKSYYYDIDNNKIQACMELTLTCTDYILFLEHYDVYNIEYIDGCYFDTEIGLFDNYINKFMEVKMNEKGAKRTLAKLFLNNLYGKMASSTDSSFYHFLYDTDNLSLKVTPEHNKKAGYIPIGSAITSYARDFTIRHAQKNYNKTGKSFIYADTDSLHLSMELKDVIGVEISPTNMLCWKCEKEWTYGKFIRPKTYIEIDDTGIDIKCAGLPDRCKNLFLKSCGYNVDFEPETKEEEEFLKEHHKLSDLSIGFSIPGKLMPKRIDGGVVLIDKEFTLRG